MTVSMDPAAVRSVASSLRGMARSGSIRASGHGNRFAALARALDQAGLALEVANQELDELGSLLDRTAEQAEFRDRWAGGMAPR